MAWVEIMLPNARTLPTGKLTQNPIRTGERRCILYVGDDSGITLARDHATHPWTIGPLVRSKTCENGRNVPSASAPLHDAILGLELSEKPLGHPHRRWLLAPLG